MPPVPASPLFRRSSPHPVTRETRVHALPCPVGRDTVVAEAVPCHGLPASLTLDLPPLAGLVLVRE